MNIDRFDRSENFSFRRSKHASWALKRIESIKLSRETRLERRSEREGTCEAKQEEGTWIKRQNTGETRMYKALQGVTKVVD